MAIKKYEDLNQIQLDTLKEIGNIGSGNAATALAQLLNRTVDMDVPAVSLVDFQQAIEYMGSPENIIAGIMIRLTGDVEGMIMFLLEEPFAQTIINGLTGKEGVSLHNFDSYDSSVLCEIGNIMGGSYVNALAGLTGMVIDISVPLLTVDMIGAIISVPAVEFSQLGDKVLLIDERFLIDSVEIKSNMLLIPTVSSLEEMLIRLGVENG